MLLKRVTLLSTASGLATLTLSVSSAALDRRVLLSLENAKLVISQSFACAPCNTCTQADHQLGAGHSRHGSYAVHSIFLKAMGQ